MLTTLRAAIAAALRRLATTIEPSAGPGPKDPR